MTEGADAGFELLNTILNAWFEPVAAGAGDLVLTGADSIAGLGLGLGTEVTVRGYLTYVSRIHRGGSGRERDLDLHITLDNAPLEGPCGLLCEIPNATDAQKAVLDSHLGDELTVTGVLRAFLAHPRPGDRPPHVFEIHPVRTVELRDGTPFPNSPVDCPQGAQWRQNDSIRPDFPFHRYYEPPVTVTYDGLDLTFSPGEPVGNNYVAMKGSFSRISSGPFPEGKPYVFHLQVPAGRKPINLVAVAIPDTPAYAACRRLHEQPSDAPLVAVALRSLHIPRLLDGAGRYEIILCPTFRLEPAT